jgi:hypothetical protein
MQGDPARRFYPVSGKGVAGGEKYIINNVFFKFVRDIHGIYGGDNGVLVVIMVRW